MKDLQSSAYIVISNTLVVIHVFIYTLHIAFISYKFATYLRRLVKWCEMLRWMHLDTHPMFSFEMSLFVTKCHRDIFLMVMI
jgi:hypothetical protein